MAFPFQDMQNFRGGLKLLFVAPLLGFFYYLNRIRQYICYESVEVSRTGDAGRASKLQTLALQA